MKANAVHREPHWKSRGMRPFLGPTLNRFIRNEPGVAATTPVASAGMTPPGDVALILIGHAEGEAIERCLTLRGEMKNIFVTIVQEPRGTDRFEVSAGDILALLVGQSNRFDPVNCVLKNKKLAQSQGQFVRQHWVGRRGAQVQE